jgi:uncharacterized membrane protein (UPF0136 family)
MFVLLLVIYNNAYTPYKIQPVNNVYKYLFLVSFVTMQLLEFFAWRNLKNRGVNLFLSVMISLLLFLQPIASMMLLENESLKTSLIGWYIVFSFLVFLVEIYFKREKSWGVVEKSISISVSPSGHLQWKQTHNPLFDSLTVLIWMYFFMFSFFYNGEFATILFALLLFAACVYGYYKDGSYKSMWCWLVNSVFLYFAFYLLIQAPFLECIGKK